MKAPSGEGVGVRGLDWDEGGEEEEEDRMPMIGVGNEMWGVGVGWEDCCCWCRGGVERLEGFQ